MNNKNIIFNHTLEQYNKKYKNRNYRLVRLTKKQVDDFDRFHNTERGYLLKGRKWWLIKDTYYEIPKPIGFTWFRNLNAGVQAGVCLLGAGAVASAITVPLFLMNQNKGDESTITVIGAEYDKTASLIELNKDSNIVLKQQGNNTIVGVESVKVGGNALTRDKDWTFSKVDKKITIKAHAMASLEIEIKVTVEDPTKETAKQKFIRLAGVYNKTFTDTTTQYTVDQIKIAAATEPRDFKAENLEYANDRSYCKLTYSYEREGVKSSVTTHINIGNSLSVLDAILKEASVSTIEYVFTDDYIEYINSDHSGAIAYTSIKFNKHGYVEKQETYMNGVLYDKLFLNFDGAPKKPVIDSNNIDWATKKIDGTNTLYDLAKKSYKIVIGTNEKYKTTAESLSELKIFDVQETGVKEGSIKAYYGKNNDGQEELYALSDKKIIFEDNDRYGRDMTIPEKGRGFFDYCTKCQSIILDNIDTSKVTDFNNTFYSCENLTSINVSNFDTSNATDMSQMFSIGTQLKLTSIIGLEKFNTEKVTDMTCMFANVFTWGPSWGRTTLDISSFSTKNLKQASRMFLANTSLETIYVSQKFVTTSIIKSDYMFEGCTSLTGGAGTTHDTSHLDKEYAKIDEGSEPNKGYFTGISTLEWGKLSQTDKYSYSIDSLRKLRAKYRTEVLEDHLIDSFKICDGDSSEAQAIDDGWKVYINGVESTELFDYDSANKIIQLKGTEHSTIKVGDVLDFELKLSSAVDKSGFAIAYKS